jgi:lysine 2,3-aminomutase
VISSTSVSTCDRLADPSADALPKQSAMKPWTWKRQLASGIVSASQLAGRLPDDGHGLEAVLAVYPMRISPYYLSLIQAVGDAIWRQAVPDPAELQDDQDQADPLFEEAQSPVPHLIHRYPDRVVLLVSNRCAVYCRHCMRKRKVGDKDAINQATIEAGIDYIRRTPTVRDVILSGGDPLLLPNHRLFAILAGLRAVAHVKIIRIHSRVPCTLPARITRGLAQGLKRFHPLWLNTQFNHPREVTAQAAEACGRLADAGIPLGCQTVLLKQVNDCPETMLELMRALLDIRVRPYYLHHPDRVRGTRHFWTSPEKGLAIMNHLRGNLSGVGVPQYMLDLPGGGGKIPLLPEYILEKRPGLWRIRNYAGQRFEYPLVDL